MNKSEKFGGIIRSAVSGDFLWEIERPQERSRLVLTDVELGLLQRIFERAMRRHRLACAVHVWLMVHGIPVSYENARRSILGMIAYSVIQKIGRR